ncbi:channel protein (hemolysin III family) [Leeuwenhoekiella aestuarii]|uniref:Channel protein (Hemolysin III family) n=1 Tax=Leeuwenhoekiella aestuarii TaxID=2249426 RepID=A0A4Q0NPU6_9FLAO|nr:hemolysin III family protein [Leeuwenhoekiella aestuarii]RXG11570.1 channel protein (hemolysin III family) [Leeuwenhoekiella aestuarii]RXG12088.1 channel protein (hemolysin III family) [Leeuwenhoekiella aestuarii]
MKHLNLNWKEEEFWNALSHGIGALMGVFGLIYLLILDAHKSAYSTLSIVFYGVSIILLYTASTIYHILTSVSWKHIFRKIDHISIYFLIAGTYTPVALISLASGNGWIIFWTVWGIAAVGTILKLFFTGRFEILSLVLYLAMGWLIVFDWDNLVTVSSEQGINLLMLGGGFYTVGILFYAIRKIPFNHFIWHLFVLAGSICHFLFILVDVI